MRPFLVRAVRRLVDGLLLPFRLLRRGLTAVGQRAIVAGHWFRRLAVHLWRFLGRLGLALRNLLTWFIWIPLLILTSPCRWLYRRLLRRPLRWLLGSFFDLLRGFWQLAGWLGLQIRYLLVWLWRLLGRMGQVIRRHTTAPLAAALTRRWQVGAPNRRRRRRRWASAWQLRRARWHVRLRPARPPRGALIAPVVAAPSSAGHRLGNYITVFVTVNVILVALSIVIQQQQPLPTTILGSDVATPSSSPTATVTPTRTPLAIQLTPTIAWPTPDPLSKGGSVAYSLRQNGQSDIYALAVGAAEPVRLTAGPGDSRQPAWSPDGRQLAYAGRRDGNWDLYILDLPAGTTRRLTHDPAYDGAPAWSPDGQWLVFESYRGDNLDLYIVRADGSLDPIRLTEHPAADFNPVWAPGGRHVAFTSLRNGGKEIYIMSLDAASDETAANLTNTPDSFEDHAAFHPRGDYLAFSDDSTGFELVYVIPLRDYAPAGPRRSIGQGRQPAWSPDGEELIYGLSRGAQDYLIASALDAWRVAPQAFVTTGRLDQPAWTAVTLPSDLPAELRRVASAPLDPLFTAAVSPPQEDGAPYLLRQLPVNAPAPYLNDRVDDSFTALRERVRELAGWDFLAQLDHMFEPLAERPLPGQSDRNWNKAGRAFDIYYRHALAFDPQVEIVREDRGSDVFWRIYLRTSAQDGSMGEPLRARPWDFRARYGPEPQYYDAGGRRKDAIPAGYYLDFTALAADYGWQPVPSDANWRTYFPGIRFWHYENRQGLTWEQAMLELYTPAGLGERFGE